MKEYAVEILLSLIGIVLGKILTYFKSMNEHVKAVSDSVSQLNLKLELVIKDMSWHKSELDGIKERLEHLENK